MLEIKLNQAKYELFPLPSNGYNPQGIVTLQVRPMTGKDERTIFTNKTLLRKGNIEDVVCSVLTGNGITRDNKEVKVDWSSMFLEDQYALMFFIQAISYGYNYEFDVKCPECNKPHHLKIHLEKDIDVVMADESIQNGITVTLPKLGIPVTMRIPTKKDDSKDIYRLIENVIVCSSEERPILREWLDSLSGGDIAELRSALNKSRFGIPKKINFVCENPSCDSEGADQEVGIPMDNFFRLRS